MAVDEDSARALGATFDARLGPDGHDGPRADPRLIAGATVGRYRLVSRLGGGAMGVVWSARDPQLDRQIAIKVVHPQLATDPEAAARLLREARAMAKVWHRGVVAIHDAGHDGDSLFIAMELVAGTTLGTMMSERSAADRRDWRRWLGLVLDAGRGLAAAHAAGVIHRDFKPDNVLVERGGRVCVGDFGVAELSAGGRGPSSQRIPTERDEAATLDNLTTTGALVGTPAYMSPEQLRGRTVDARSDQFAFCVTAWEALYGDRPFPIDPAPDQEPLEVLLVAIEAGRIGTPPAGTVPRRVREVLERGLAADPAARWPDLATLLAALAPRRRWRSALAIGAAAVVVAAGAAALVATLRPREPGPPRRATARHLFSVPLKVGVSLAPSGDRIALITPDRVVVRELHGRGTWSWIAPGGARIDRGHYVGDQIELAVRTPTGVRVQAWSPVSGALTEGRALGAGRWVGPVDGGDLVEETRPGGFDLAIVGGGTARTVMSTTARTEVLDVSPDRRRVALVEPGTFEGRLVVLELATGAQLRSEPIVELSGVTWRDNTRLLYTTGTIERPGVHEARVEADRLVMGRLLYESELGWFGQIDAARDRVVFVDSTNSFRCRMITDGVAADLDPSRISAGLGWERGGTWLSWNRTTGDLERRDGTQLVATLPAAVEGEPGNATRADDTLILSMRRKGGRELTGTSLVDGRGLWRHPVGASVLARCAADDRPPCFAITQRSGQPATVRTLDPATGILGGEALLTAPTLLDLAVSPAGDELLYVEGASQVGRLDLATRAVRTERTTLSATRSLAFHPAGGYLLAGSTGASSYHVVWVRDGTETLVAQGKSELLFLPRQSPDGAHLLVMGRLFLPDLLELVL